MKIFHRAFFCTLITVPLANIFQLKPKTMLLLISPAKTLNFDKTPIESYTMPNLLKQTEQLVKILKKLKTKDLMGLMDVSEKIAELNVERFKTFKQPFNLDNAKQAVLAFDGDVYDGLSASDFDAEDLAFTQAHLRILSGLYGLLRPLDLMQPYRLEMGTTLENPKGKNLYTFWGETITEELNKTLLENKEEMVINLASNEYWSAVKPKLLKADVIDIQFKEKRGDAYKVISFNAKKARGLMCRYVVKNRLTKPAQLRSFDWENYSLNESLSSEKEWVFVR